MLMNLADFDADANSRLDAVTWARVKQCRWLPRLPHLLTEHLATYSVNYVKHQVTPVSCSAQANAQWQVIWHEQCNLRAWIYI